MNNDVKRPILMLLTGHWLSMLGVALVTTAGFSWLFTLPTQLRGHKVKPGSFIRMAPLLSHAVRAKTSFRMLLIQIKEGAHQT